MINILNNHKVLFAFALITLIMFAVIMFIINPIIDGKNGIDIIRIQLTYDKQEAIEIINSWDNDGIYRFKQLIFTDYIYALFYGLFFTSLLTVLVYKTGSETNKLYKSSIFLGIYAAFFDWTENTIELLFINDMQIFSNNLYILHSFISTLKWLTLPLVVILIISLVKNLKTQSKS